MGGYFSEPPNLWNIRPQPRAAAEKKTYSCVTPQICFGKYPQDLSRFTPEWIVVNLTASIHGRENIHFPIPDDRPPARGPQLETTLADMCRELAADKSIFIHCKNGRGRSGVVVILLLMRYHHLSLVEAIRATNEAHWSGHGNTDHWRRRVIPTHKAQREFLEKY